MDRAVAYWEEGMEADPGHAETLADLGVARGAVWARNGEGLARRQAGDFAGAAAAFRRALALARENGDALNEAVSLNLLGRLLLRFGDPGRAEAMLDRAGEIHRRHRHHREGLLARLDVADEVEHRVDVDRVLAKLQPDTRLVFIVNPGNPSGTVIHNDEIRRLRAALPDEEKLWTFWDYQRGAWPRDAGFRIDHLLCSPRAATIWSQP